MHVADILQIAGPPPAPPRRRLRRGLIAATVTASLAAVGLVAHFSARPAAESGESSADSAREAARSALAAFLAAPSPEDRAALVLEGDKLLPLLQAWEAAHEPPSFSAADFRAPAWSFDAAASRLTALELPRHRGLPPVVACFKQAPDGRWLLDWETFTQSLDASFRDFIHRPAEGEHTLRARLTRAGSGDAMALTIADPFHPADSLSFPIARPDLQALYDRDLPESGTRTATVQLVWLNDALTGTLTPALRRHVCWGFPGLDGEQPPAVVINMRSKHRPPAGTPAVPPSPEAPAAVLAAAPAIQAAVDTTLAPGSTAPLPGTLAPVLPAAQTVSK